MWQCKEDKPINATEPTPTPPTEASLPAPKEEKMGLDELQANAAIGQIKEACQLISEAWVVKNIPGFEDGDVKLVSRTSPDGNASACQCTKTGGADKVAFVIGYRVSAGNMQYINGLMKDGLQRENAANIPPYLEVRGLGQRAAFSRANGNLAWVTDSGLYIYMYIYPLKEETMRPHFDLLYALAPEINEVVAKYGNKG